MTMKVESTNIGHPTEIKVNERIEWTGFFKISVVEGIQLTPDGVRGDFIADKKNHGDIFKSCYLYSTDHYNFWKNLYPSLSWQFGFFGENLSVSNIIEKDFFVGDVLKIGSSLVMVTQPRQPCYKLGIRFGDPHIVSKFKRSSFPGIYLKTLKEGFVRKGDIVEKIEEAKVKLNIVDLFEYLYSDSIKRAILNEIMENPLVPPNVKTKLSTKVVVE